MASENAEALARLIASRVRQAAVSLLDTGASGRIDLPTGDSIIIEPDPTREDPGCWLVLARPATERREAASERVWLGAERIRQTSVGRFQQILEGFDRNVSPWHATLVGGEKVLRAEFVSRYDPYDHEEPE